MISNRAAAIAVITAFVVGLLGSLAVRPPGGNAASVTTGGAGTADVRVRWRVAQAASSNLPVVGESTIKLRDTLLATSGGAIRFDLAEPGEIVPAFAITDAVREGKVEAGITFVGYDQGKIPASALISAVPFGMEPIEFIAWWYAGEGRELGEELYRPHRAHPILCGLTGPETAGWFRSPIKSLDDIRGLKIRFAGIGGKVMEKAGASVTMLPPGEIFQALEKGAIDATEYALPIMDQALGLDRIAKFNYYPGWHQIFTSNHLLVNLDAWEAISDADRATIEAGCVTATMYSIAISEARQGAVVAGLADSGVTAVRLPDDVLRELQVISREVLDENAANDPMFARILESQRRFLEEYAHWKRLAYLPRDF